jgi:hypothetical protein
MTPSQAAWLRGAYGALGTGIASGLVIYMAMLGQDEMSRFDRLEIAALNAGIAALGYLGFRGGVEGRMDQARDERGAVNTSDVGQPRPGSNL